jgi:hypothetical protein
MKSLEEAVEYALDKDAGTSDRFASSTKLA